MMHVEPSFVLYALLLDPGCCLRAHTVLSGTVELLSQKKKKDMPDVVQAETLKQPRSPNFDTLQFAL